MKGVTEMSNDELAESYASIYSQIEVVDCFGMSDLVWRELLEREIDRRGGTITTHATVSFGEDEEEE